MVKRFGSHLTNPRVQWTLPTRPMAGNALSRKSATRRRWEAVRRSLSPQAVSAKGGEVLRRLAALPVFVEAPCVGLFAAQGFEPNLDALVVPTRARGVLVGFPQVLGEAMQFVAIDRIDTLVTGRFGLREPPPGGQVVAPSVLVVPGVAFTREGGRLGRGGGFYDRFLAARPTTITIGVCFSESVADELPLEPHDHPVDWLVTDAFAQRAARSANSQE